MTPPVEPAQESPSLKRGLRQTEQRKAVFQTLMAQTDHPTAVEIFMRVKNRMPSISLATVYNCLDTLAALGQVRTVNHEREPSRYCANLSEHAHFFCTHCGGIMDLPLHTFVPPEQIWVLPQGATVTDQEVSFRGLCPSCSNPAPPNPSGQPTR